MNEELAHAKTTGTQEREDKQKLYSMQLVLNQVDYPHSTSSFTLCNSSNILLQTRAQNNVLENELKTVREKLRREEEEGSKARLSCDHLTLRVAGLEELVRKGNITTTERSVIHSFY